MGDTVLKVSAQKVDWAVTVEARLIDTNTCAKLEIEYKRHLEIFVYVPEGAGSGHPYKRYMGEKRTRDGWASIA